MKMKNETLFWSKVAKKGPDECWDWTGAVKQSGYGTWTSGHYTEAKSVLPHRVAFYAVFGPIPKGMLVCHRCDNRKCCNPSHLWLGTDKENTQDAIDKGRWKIPRGSAHGKSKITEDDVKGILSDNRLYREIAVDYGVHESTVCNIKAKRYWKHVSV